MFYLPIPIEGNSGEPVSVKKRIVPSRFSRNLVDKIYDECQCADSQPSQGYEYMIFRYNQQISESANNAEPYTVITNTDKTKVFAYMAPRETIEFASFRNNYQEGDSVEVKESIEGTMITFFWNCDTEEWNICTRNGVGGNYSFARPTKKGDEAPKTFRKMVVDAFKIALMRDGIAKPDYVQDLNDVAALDKLSKTHCYTCILHHPGNHIVYSRSPFCAFLKLVAIYEVGSMPPLIDSDSDIRYNDCVRELANPDYPEFEKTYLQNSKEEGDDEIWKTGYSVFSRPGTTSESIQTFDDFLTFKKEVFDNYVDTMIVKEYDIRAKDIGEYNGSKYYPPSWIMTNNRTGHKCEIKNPFYEMAKNLRNMQPNMLYQYLQLRSSYVVNDYLIAFPQYKEDFVYFESEYERFVTEVHSAYVKFYIKKERDNNIPKRYFVHAARIHHNEYLTQQVPRTKVTRATVYAYFGQFSATKMFYFMTRTEENEKTDDVEVSEHYPIDSSPIVF